MEATLYSFCWDVNSVPAPPQKPSLSPLGTTSSLSRSPPGLQTCSARQPLDQRPRCWDPGLSLSSSQNCLCSLQSAIPRIIVQDVWGRDQFRVFVKLPAGSWFWGMRLVENRPGCLESSCRTFGGEGVPGPPVIFLPELRVAKCYLHKEHCGNQRRWPVWPGKVTFERNSLWTCHPLFPGKLPRSQNPGACMPNTLFTAKGIGLDFCSN